MGIGVAQCSEQQSLPSYIGPGQLTRKMQCTITVHAQSIIARDLPVLKIVVVLLLNSLQIDLEFRAKHDNTVPVPLLASVLIRV